MPRQATIADAATTIADDSFYGMLTRADRDQLCDQGSMQSYAPRSRLMLEGDLAANVTILIRGWAKSVFATASGTEVVLRIYGPGDLFGSEAMIKDQCCTEMVTALVPCLALTVPGSCLSELLVSNHGLASAFRQVMAWRALAAEEQAKSRFASPARELARVLLNLADRHGVQAPDGVTIPVELTQEELAGMIGVSRSTVARVLRNLRLRGMVNTGYRRITVTALQPLQAIAAS